MARVVFEYEEEIVDHATMIETMKKDLNEALNENLHFREELSKQAHKVISLQERLKSAENSLASDRKLLNKTIHALCALATSQRADSNDYE